MAHVNKMSANLVDARRLPILRDCDPKWPSRARPESKDSRDWQQSKRYSRPKTRGRQRAAWANQGRRAAARARRTSGRSQTPRESKETREVGGQSNEVLRIIRFPEPAALRLWHDNRSYLRPNARTGLFCRGLSNQNTLSERSFCTRTLRRAIPQFTNMLGKQSKCTNAPMPARP